MRAAFSMTVAVSGSVLDLKAYPSLDESQTEVKRTTAYKDAVSGTVSPDKPKSKDSAKVERVSVSKSTGEVLDKTQIIKGAWRNDHEFVEIPDETLEYLRMTNGEFRVVGVNDGFALETKGASYVLLPSKTTKEALARFVGLQQALGADGDVLIVEGAVRGRQRLYAMFSEFRTGVVYLQEIAYAEEMLDDSVFPMPSTDDVIDPIEIDLHDLPALREVPTSSYITAFNDKYGSN